MIPITTLIATKSEIKSLLGITSNDYDSKIDLYLPILQDELLNNALGNNFGAGWDLTAEEVIEPIFPNNLKLVMVEMVKENIINENKTSGNIISYSIGDYSVSFDVSKTATLSSQSLATVLNYRKIYKDEPVKTVI
jgi:RNAse (barnase) inhibitor barstar